MQGLINGRNVHYVEQGEEHSAAIITKVWNDDGLVNLFVMRSGNVIDNRAVTSVNYSEEPKPNTWHWIEKA